MRQTSKQTKPPVTTKRSVAKPKPVAHARSKPPQTAEIIKSMQSLLPPDAETQDSVNKRLAPFTAPPRRAGASASGKRKNNPPV